MLIATVSTQRSGTKLLSQCFVSGTVVCPFGEIFNPDVPQLGSFQDFMAARGNQLIPLGLDHLLDRFFEAFHHIRPIPAIDVMFNQLEIPTVTWNPHPYAGFYGYLRARNSVVVGLERDPFDCFVSMRYLEVSGVRAHRFRPGDTLATDIADQHLDEADLRRFLTHIAWHRQQLERAMEEYPYFYRLPYDELARTGLIPEDLRTLIGEAAAAAGIPIPTGRIQLHAPAIQRSDVDYAQVFTNFAELRARYAAAG